MSKNIIGTILFTDIVSSSKLWKSSHSKMLSALKKHDNLIEKLTKRNKGLVVKTIGDAYMLYFKSWSKALTCAMEIQYSLKTYPIKVGKCTLRLRIGMAHGPIVKRMTNIQNKKLVDFFGHTVNVASRMESKVGKPGQVVFANCSKKSIKDFPFHPTEIKQYRFKCTHVPRKKRRSSRLLQGYQCLSANLLHGVGPATAYVFG